ncbi:unnamed protein product [Parascedosporium putredinis]|uniref:Uncharacterized protein n=1 Tax=Parascedosporium putredinis TaxID=1442378 RepID=A0A9P1M6R8_9PEZI|nr:unnamed protein product [Parascedosporium putredinis]CAI7987627.1 unnamed protein product [Parascedosporium putredinis]
MTNLGHYGFNVPADRRQTQPVLEGILHSTRSRQQQSSSYSRSSHASYSSSSRDPQKRSDSASVRSRSSFASTMSLLSKPFSKSRG